MGLGGAKVSAPFQAPTLTQQADTNPPQKPLTMKKASSFLTGFLAMLVAAGLFSPTGTAQAAIVNIDVSAFNGINGGIAAGTFADFTIITGVNLRIYNNYTNFQSNTFTGLGNAGSRGTLEIANGAVEGNIQSRPFAYNPGQSIKSTIGPQGFTDGVGSIIISSFSQTIVNNASWYSTGTFTSPDFTSSNYLGFKTQAGNYGWLNTTWTASTGQFQVLGGAYESVVGADIFTPSAPVPEPGTWAAAALLASGAGFMRWRKRKQVS
jgi:hypothetical protein